MKRLNAAFDAAVAHATGRRLLDPPSRPGHNGPDAPAPKPSFVDRRRGRVAHDHPSFTIDALPAEAFEALEKLGGTHARKFDVVICDPPAFVKSRKDLKTGAQGYRKLVRLAAPLVARGGFFFVASCSHLVDTPLFAEQVRRGLRDGEAT